MTTARYAIGVVPPESRVGPRSWSLRVLVDILLEWHERARQRRQLMALSDHLLKDVGINRADAEHEASKPFWRP